MIKVVSLKILGFLKPMLTCSIHGRRLQLHEVAPVDVKVFQYVIQCLGNFSPWTRGLGVAFSNRSDCY